jgi:DNA-binding transcriptional LysR family regulator
MENSDYLGIDGRQLHILLTIQKAGSLSGAARMLDMNQSTVSYWLDQLRARTGDPLFVRFGNGVIPTERAKLLFPEAEAALRHVEAMFTTPDYDPETDAGTFRIAATAVERTILIDPFLQIVRTTAPGLMIEVVQPGSAFQIMQKLQEGTLDLCFLPPGAQSGDGVMQRKLKSFHDLVFFDPEYPLEEGDLDAFCARPHARVALGPDASFAIDRRLAKLGRKRHVALQVSDFDSALALIKGTDIIVTLPDVFTTSGLSTIRPPWPTGLVDIGMFWHARSQTSARHSHWRKVLVEVSKTSPRQVAQTL